MPPAGPIVTTFAELDAWLRGRIARAESYLADGETAQAFGRQYRTQVEAFTEVRAQIADAVNAEAAEAETVAHSDAIEAAYKEAGYTGRPELALLERERDGDR